MHPAFSILFFTTLAGMGQGLVVAIALALLIGIPAAPAFVTLSIAVGEVMLVAGLASSFLHLGNKLRAWRSVLMWRTSWMSREVIVLPAFIALLAVWWATLVGGLASPWSAVAALLVLVGAAALWYCTAMIYACLRFIEEWAHPLTIVNYALIGLSSGFTLACALAVLSGETGFVAIAGPCALVVTIVAGFSRWASVRRNAAIRHRSDLQSATGIRASQLVQKSMGMTAGSFNTREFFHHASAAAVRMVRWIAFGFGFALPSLLLLWGVAAGGVAPWLLAVLVQVPGVLADRWYFFAQAKHPQNLYYQAVS